MFFLLRVLYFLFVGVVLGFFWVAAAYLLMLTIVGLPIGVAMLNWVPQVVTLRPPGERTQRLRNAETGRIVEYRSAVPQRPFLIRAVWFLLVGFWLTGLWLLAAWMLSCTFIGLPISFVMYGATPSLLTLHRNR